jgi:hypothetical protein
MAAPAPRTTPKQMIRSHSIILYSAMNETEMKCVMAVMVMVMMRMRRMMALVALMVWKLQLKHQCGWSS